MRSGNKQITNLVTKDTKMAISKKVILWHILLEGLGIDEIRAGP
jgi:hypothetical protein